MAERGFDRDGATTRDDEHEVPLTVAGARRGVELRRLLPGREQRLARTATARRAATQARDVVKLQIETRCALAIRFRERANFATRAAALNVERQITHAEPP